jgi:hypothetical protein
VNNVLGSAKGAAMPVVRKDGRAYWDTGRGVDHLLPIVGGGAIPNTANPPNSQQTGSAGKSAQALPFVQSSSDLLQSFGTTNTIAGTAWSGVTPIGPLDIVALGYLRGLWIEVSATGGSGTADVAFNADAPFNVIQTGQMSDSVNAPFYGPHTGWDMYAIHKYGGYAHHDPKLDHDYNGGTAGADASGDFFFRLFLPAEVIRRIGLGSLPNQNSAATNKLQLFISDPSTVYATAPTNLPSITVTTYLDAWNNVALHDVAGNMLTQTPPGGKLRQYWTESTFNAIPDGQYELQLVRKGYYFRNLIFVGRNSSGVRENSVFPNPIQWTIDGNTRTFIYPNLSWTQMQEAYELSGDFSATGVDYSGSLDEGVLVIPFDNDLDGNAWRGNELRTKWVASLKASNYWFQGSWGGGSAIVITNDIAPDPSSSVWLPEPLLL